jgi:NADH dehydrogenase
MVDKVLNTFSDKSQEYAARILEQRGVQLRLGSAVKEVTSNNVLLTD